MKNKQVLQVVILVVVAIVIVCASVVATVYVRSPGFSSSVMGGKSASSYHRPVSLGEAQMVCDQYVRRVLVKRLQRLVLDSHSTRTEEDEGEHWVFFEARLLPEEGDESRVADDYFLQCHVYLDRPEVSNFDFSKQEEFKPRAVRGSAGNDIGL